MRRALHDRLIKAECESRLARGFLSFQTRGSVSGPAAFSEATLAEDWRRQWVAPAIGAGDTP
jgi:hypothetical protein